MSLLRTLFLTPNRVRVALYVQGANIDAGAKVLIDNQLVATVPHKWIPNAFFGASFFGVGASALDYPIFHYRALVALVPGPKDAGSSIAVTVRNEAGQLSNVLNYQLPTSAQTLDSDGDDIPDVWELFGYDWPGNGPGVDIDLPALGAHHLRPDILLEVDRMTGLTHPPGQEVFKAVQDAFANAPIINPMSPNGINLILDTLGSAPHAQWACWDDEACSSFAFATCADGVGDGPASVTFLNLKSVCFNNDIRGRLFHYCVWAYDAAHGGRSDPADYDSQGTGGDDCLLAVDTWSFWEEPTITPVARSRFLAELLMHELGHLLNQRHGGTDDFGHNPTYNSVLSLSWIQRTARRTDPAGWRREHPICTRFYYASANGIEIDGAVPSVINLLIGYSEGMGRGLFEKKHRPYESGLHEELGICGLAVDWDLDGAITGLVVKDLTGDGDVSDHFHDFANWPALVFVGPRHNGYLKLPGEP